MTFSKFRFTIITGAVLLIPIAAILYFATIIFTATRDVVAPLVKYFDIESVAGFIILNLLALFVVLLVCFLAGLAAKMAFVSNRVQMLDDRLQKIVPGYSLIVGTLRGTISADDSVETMRPVIAKVGNLTRLGFEIERAPENHVVVFLPGVPNAQAGIAAAIHEDDVQYVDLPPHKIVEMMQFYGKGLAKLASEHLEAKEQVSL